MQKYSCQLEKTFGIEANHIGGLCKGIYCVRIESGGILKHEYHEKCKNAIDLYIVGVTELVLPCCV